ncbi:MAG: hypothetical protein PCFJNLEI_01591 [Verrucomicrobiae bacterium]|nr:hypothetical protein [Verrucomicrobiae bacterium]
MKPPQNRKLRVAAVQIESAAGNKDDNFVKIEAFAKPAAGRERDTHELKVEV